MENAHGDIVGLSDAQSNVIKTYTYDAFGVEQNIDPNDTNPFRYCGEYYDELTGDIYLRARYYRPSAGRFFQEDPAKDGLNWYNYCEGNPIKYKDPSGLEPALDEYINNNYAGQKSITIVISRPVANSRDAATIENGKLNNGHSFIRLDDGNGNVQYIGFGPVSSSISDMILGNNVEGHFIDDSQSDWNVAKIYTITDEQYSAISEYISKVKSENKAYNIETNNCTTFAVNVSKIAGAASGNFMTIREHKWSLPSNMEEQLANYSALPSWLSPNIAAFVIKNTMGNFYGYTPADAAQDLKSAEGVVLLKYDGSIKTITNTTYFN